MANIKAGVAYVDIRLGSAKPLTDAIEREVIKAGDTASKAAGKKITEGLTKNTTAKPAATRIISAPFACIGKLKSCVGLVFAVTRTGQPKTEDNRLRENATEVEAADHRQKAGYVRRCRCNNSTASQEAMPSWAAKVGAAMP